ncbi:MAG: hypothetical protein P8008_06525 [Gammaproteobacteria bacterium]
MGIAYAIAAWIILQATDVIGEILDLPQWGGKLILLMLGVGFVISLFLAWAFELTPEGLKRESEVDRNASITRVTGRKLDRAIIVVLALALAWFAWDKFSGGAPAPAPPESAAATATGPEAPSAEKAVDQSIAVLPFINMSADADNEYFSDGLSEELLNLLAQVEGLKVAARTSTFKFKGSDADIAEIGEKLNVATVLEGSVRKAGDQVRITAQLIKVDDGFHLWSENYDRRLDNIFEVQDEIASAIVDALKLPLLGENEAAVGTRATANFEAYDLFLLGRHHEQARNEAGFEKAIENYTEAVTLDPGYAPAWAGLARSWLLLADYGTAPMQKAEEEARRALERAMSIDPKLPDTLSAQADLYFYTGELSRQIETLERLVALDPDHVDGLSDLGGHLETDPERGLELVRRAWELDPLSELTRIRLVAATAARSGRDEALALARDMLESDPANPGLYEVMANINRSSGHLDEAVAAYEATHRLRPGDVFPAWQIVSTSLLMDDPQAANRWLDIARERGAGTLWADAATTILDLYEENFETILSKHADVVSGSVIPWAETTNMVATALMRAGRTDDARRLLRSAASKYGVETGPVLDGDTARIALKLAALLPAGEERSGLLQRVNEFSQALKQRRPHYFQGWWLGASAASIAGDREALLADLDRAIDAGFRGAEWLASSPLFARWADDPGFRERVLRLDGLSAAHRERTAALHHGAESDA